MLILVGGFQRRSTQAGQVVSWLRAKVVTVTSEDRFMLSVVATQAIETCFNNLNHARLDSLIRSGEPPDGVMGMGPVHVSELHSMIRQWSLLATHSADQAFTRVCAASGLPAVQTFRHVDVLNVSTAPASSTAWWNSTTQWRT